MRTIALIIAAVTFTACGTSQDSEQNNVLRESALAEWTSMVPEARNIICDIYNELGRGNHERFIEQIRDEPNPDSVEYVEAQVEIMEEQC